MTERPSSSHRCAEGPVVGVGAVVFHDGRVLLIRRGKPPRLGEWSLPGGRQEAGETVFEAVAREVREETAVVIRPLAVLDVVDLIDRDPETGRLLSHFTLVDVLAAWISGRPQAGDDALEAVWMEYAAVAGVPLWNETRRVLELGFRAWTRQRHS